VPYCALYDQCDSAHFMLPLMAYEDYRPTLSKNMKRVITLNIEKLTRRVKLRGTREN